MTDRRRYRRDFITAGALGTVGALAGLASTPAAAASAPTATATAASGGMSRQRYLQYVNWFNANDPRFLEFYHPEVVLWLGNATLKGANAIRDFYNEVKQHIHEKVEVTHFVSDSTGVAAELPSEFKVFKDWPEPNYFKRPLKAGEAFRVVSLGLYVVENGLFRDIKAARFKLVNDWRMEG